MEEECQWKALTLLYDIAGVLGSVRAISLLHSIGPFPKFVIDSPREFNQIGLCRQAKGHFFQAFLACIGVLSVMNDYQDKRHLLGQIAQIYHQMYSIFGLLGMAAGLTGQLFQVLATCIYLAPCLYTKTIQI